MISLCGLQAQIEQLLEHKLWSNHVGEKHHSKNRTYTDSKNR